MIIKINLNEIYVASKTSEPQNKFFIENCSNNIIAILQNFTLNFDYYE